MVEKLSNTELADEGKLGCFVDFWFGMLAMLFHTTRNLEYEWYVEHNVAECLASSRRKEVKSPRFGVKVK